MTFYFTYAIAALLLVIPGYLMLRSVGFARTWSVALSPLVTASVLVVLGCVFARVGIFSNAMSLLSAFLAIDVVLLLVMRTWRKGQRCTRELRLPSIDWKILIAYVVVGLLLGYYVFYRCIDGPSSFSQAWDVGHHINVTRAMMDSGRFSVFGTDAYMTAKDVAVAPFGVGRGFYPTGVYSLYALVCEVSGSALTVCINAANLAFCCFVFPLGVAAVISVLFPEDKRMLAVGAVACLCLVGCPWNFLTWGPLFPNLAGICCVPAFLMFFAFLVSPHSRGTVFRLWQLILFLLSTFGIGCLHPNSLFSAAVLLIPYIFHRIWILGSVKLGGSRHLSGRFLAFCFAALCMVLWYAAYKVLSIVSPGLVTFDWPPFAGKWQEIINILTQSYLGGFNGFDPDIVVSNFIPAILVIVGAYKIARDGEKRWVLFTYLLACFICFVGATTDGTLKHIVAGFWYTDPVRLAATASMAAIPLVVVGGKWLVDLVKRLVCRRHGASRQSCLKYEGVILLVIVAIVYMPSLTLPGFNPFRTAFGGFRQCVHDWYHIESPLSRSEADFLTQAQQVTGDALVINNPWDGSHIAYGLTGMRTYYRGFAGYGTEGESADSRLIREHLDEYADRQDVRDAVKKIGAKYVMTLNKPSELGSYVMIGIPDPNLFEGVRSTGTWSPAFKEVLTSEDGTCHLYKIVE
ncbi:MAG: hypothetical protein LKF00_09680 [Olsenella sp.]|jgi:hypothetical protein|nr:hypothetical protein [Olsenella sp.]MCI1288361.1 hypothetical protein [Olsenella sp.]